MRDAYKGTSKALRKHLLKQEDFSGLLRRTERDIREAVAEKVAKMQHKGSNFGEAVEVWLLVDGFCECGKHRSVAFVEELARLDWLKDWDIEVVHMDPGSHVAKNQHKNERSEKSKAQFAIHNNEE